MWKNGKLVVDDDGSGDKRTENIIKSDHYTDPFANGSRNSSGSYKRQVWNNGKLVLDDENSHGFGGPNLFDEQRFCFGHMNTNFDFPSSDQHMTNNYRRRVWKNGQLVVDDSGQNAALSGFGDLRINDYNRFDQFGQMASNDFDINRGFRREIGFEGLSDNIQRGYNEFDRFGNQYQNNIDFYNSNLFNTNNNFFLHRSNRIEDNCNLM